MNQVDMELIEKAQAEATAALESVREAIAELQAKKKEKKFGRRNG